MGLWPKEARLYAIWIVAVFLVIYPEAQAGSITGEVILAGATPSHAPISVTKDQDYCGKTLPDESYLLGPARGLKNVVVYIDEPKLDAALKGEAKENLLENRGCRFVPRVMAMRSGERLIVRNNDPKLHIVHAYSEKRTVFNLSLPFRGQKLDITHKIKRPGLLQVNCDTHNWMRGYIHVFGHPFFAVTDERGSFSIGNIPAGKYTLKAWHEEGGIRSTEIMVPEEGEIKTHVEFGRRSLQ